MAEVRFCRDCRHLKAEDSGLNRVYCGSPKQPIFDLVNGLIPLAETARLDPSKMSPPNFQTCGPTGQWFDPKEE